MLRRRNEFVRSMPHCILAARLTGLAAIVSVRTAMLRLIAIFVGVACLIGCRGAPVQEMSDARQAIAAAREAGVTESASPDLYAAQAAIVRAETHLQAQEFARARYAALQAKRHAVAAIANATRVDAQHIEAPAATPQ